MGCKRGTGLCDVLRDWFLYIVYELVNVVDSYLPSSCAGGQRGAQHTTTSDLKGVFFGNTFELKRVFYNRTFELIRVCQGQ